MKNYRVTVNGVAYDVVVEEVSGTQVPTYVAPAPVAAPAAAPAPAATPAPAAAPAPTAAPAPSGKAGATVIKAPMPGTLIKVNVKPGDAVKKGDILCVLEAMKMENDIMAPADGVVASVEASQGSSVATNAVLVTLN